jgi:thioredoxin-related protein
MQKLLEAWMAYRLRSWFYMTLFLAAAALATASPSPAAELLMFESDSCQWCRVWHAEIGPIYPKTSEGKKAPLRTVDIDAPRPDDLDHIQGIRFTPTFVLIDEGGREIGRINGYPGQDFFWGLLDKLIAKLPRDLAPTTST